MSKRSRTEKGKAVAQPSSQAPRPVRLFLNDLAADRYSHLSTRNINSGRFVAIQDFEHLNIPHILQTNNLVEFLTIKEQVYTSLVPYFYANLIGI